MPDAETPRFRVSNEGEPFPPVDPEDVKRVWKIKPGDKEGWIAERARALDHSAISKRSWMIRAQTGAANSWRHGNTARNWIRCLPCRGYISHPDVASACLQDPGRLVDGFDPNAFVAKLIEETGISPTREPVLARHQGGLFYTKVRATSNNQARPNLEREAKQDAQERLWAVWSKCHPNLSRASGNHEIHVASVAWHFADFVIDNIQLAREFVSKMSGGGGRPLAIVLELERNAVWGDYFECSVRQRLMREHSDEEMTRCSQALPPGSTLYRVRTS